MKKIDVAGKSRDDLGRLLKSYDRQDLLDLIYQLATWPPKFKIATVAATADMTKRSIEKAIRDGDIPVVHKPSENQTLIPLPSLQVWDESTAIRFQRSS